ncbi:hypothetical protein [Salinimicrobium gaetbulicola]|uniref:PepSY-like beta-lactamase-inhibitor n=1 Tax=Salinimicrobium gaetbulicola TaxID=999702 RepID=A0ABW3IF91_9FLAO
MRKSITLFFLLLSISGISQQYQKTEVIDKAKEYLKSSVGENLYKYFELSPDSFYKYRTKSGKIKWENINEGKKTKGEFVNAKQMVFLLNHPDFQYKFVDKTIIVQLDSQLNLSEKINLDKIPKFLLNDKNSDWISEEKIDKIISDQDLKKSIRKPIKRLEFDSKNKYYYWIVFNTLYQEMCFSNEEILWISPKTGEILKHFEERQHQIDCK